MRLLHTAYGLYLRHNLEGHAHIACIRFGAPTCAVAFATLQVLGMPNVYACGDCADVAGCPKTAFAADLQAELVAKNILRSLTSQPPLQFPQGVCFDKEKVPTICAVSLYKYDGVLVVNWVVVTGLLAAAAKALIERMQVAAARGNAVVRCVWGLMERVSVLIGSKLLY